MPCDRRPGGPVHRTRLPFALHLALHLALPLALALALGAVASRPATAEAATLAPAPPAGAALVPLSSPLTTVQEPIVNGVPSWANPSVGYFVDDFGECTGTLIGCTTFLTAAHCICSVGEDTLPGSQCAQRSDLLNPASKSVFFQHAGLFGVSKVTVHPNFLFGTRSDLAILELAAPVPGVRPSRINQVGRPAIGTTGAIVGFGITQGNRDDSGIKRAGMIETAPCTGGLPNSTHICWDFSGPLGAPGSSSNTCPGDSGGPLFFDFGTGPVLGGVTSGGDLTSCLQGDHAFDADVFVDRAWIQQVAGTDLHRTDCGALAFAGEPGGTILAGSGNLSASDREDRFTFEVPAGLGRAAVTLNGATTGDFDLYVRRGTAPTTGNADCSSENEFTLETCVFDAPQAGTYHVLVSRFDGSGDYQVTTTLFGSADTGGGGGGGGDDNGSGAPAPPAGPWLSSPGLQGFEAKVLINNATAGRREADCIPETLCMSGALAGRPEIFVKVIGPRQNGFLWTQISRFTPSKVELWLRRTSSGQINYYKLSAVGAASDDVSGLQDREAFTP